MKKLVIIGSGETAETMYEYFTHDSQYTVVAFSAEQKYITDSNLFGKPIIPFEELEKHYPPEECDAFVALSYDKLNRVRTRMFTLTKQKGYRCANFVSSTARLWPTTELGENNCIMEYCVAEPKVKIGNNVVLIHGTIIGHSSVIEDNCWIACSIVSGLVQMGKNCFIGSNSAIADAITIEDDCFISLGSSVNKNCTKGGIYAGNPAKRRNTTAYKRFGVKEP